MTRVPALSVLGDVRAGTPDFGGAEVTFGMHRTFRALILASVGVGALALAAAPLTPRAATVGMGTSAAPIR